MDIRPPKELKDCRTPDAITFDYRTAEKYADNGFYPNNEKDAEAI